MKISELIRTSFHQPYFVCLLAIFTCLCFYKLKEAKNTGFAKIIWVVYSLLFASSILIFIISSIQRYYNPQVWDFGAWYLYGKVAAQGYNYYSPEHFNAVFNAIRPTMPSLDYSGFIGAAVNVGFPYPPPTILYFVPLGFFSYNTGYIIWTLFTMIFVFADVYLIYSMFFKPDKWNGLLLSGILFFIFLPTLSTISFSQTNFLLLFYLLIIAKYPDKKFSGVILALLVFTKPYMVIVALFFFITKKWKPIKYFILSSLLLNGLMLALYGKEIFVSYIFDNPSHRAPARVFSEDVNQSLNAVLLRNNLITLAHPLSYVYIITVIILLTGCFLFFLYRKKLYDLILPTLLLIGLLIYPGTLSHYGVILLFIIFQFFNQEKNLGFNPHWNILIIGLFYYLTTISVFSAICFILGIILLKALQSFFPKLSYEQSVQH